MKQIQQGFTLIELLICVAIVGILAKIAYPSYQENIKQSKRKEAQAALVSFANAMEMWKLQHNNSYLGAGPSGADTGAPTIFPTQSPVSGGTATYDLTIDAATAQTYTLKATPVTGYSDASCGWLSITSSGVKSSATASSVCW